MMREKIREQLLSNMGKKKKFKYKGARNQNEEFCGYINNVYSNVFTIYVEQEQPTIKSFSYSDLLIGTLEIIDK